MTTEKPHPSQVLQRATASNLARLVELSPEVAVELGLDSAPAGLPVPAGHSAR